MAVGTETGTIELLDSRTFALLTPPIKVSAQLIATITFSADGALLLAQDFTGSSRLVDVNAREPVGAAIAGNGDGFGWPSFSPGGDAIVLPHAGGSVVLDLDAAVWRKAVCARAGRPLTQTEWDAYFSAAGAYEGGC